MLFLSFYGLIPRRNLVLVSFSYTCGIPSSGVGCKRVSFPLSVDGVLCNCVCSASFSSSQSASFVSSFPPYPSHLLFRNLDSTACSLPRHTESYSTLSPFRVGVGVEILTAGDPTAEEVAFPASLVTAVFFASFSAVAPTLKYWLTPVGTSSRALAT